MDIVVSDTNILIDLAKANLLYEFFKLPIRITTIDLVVAEIKSEQEAIEQVIRDGLLRVKKFDEGELLEMISFHGTFRGNVSLTDTTAIHYAIELNAVLFTGDRIMREQAQHRGVVVKGLLFVFDELVKNGVISKECAADRLEGLILQNKRLPLVESKKRIDAWRCGEDAY